jgi:hypothetical protein
MSDQAVVDWPTCGEPGCVGIRLARGGKCLAHASTRRRTVVLRQLHQTGKIDARGIPITEALLQQILAAAPRDTANHPTFATALFTQATFRSDAGFGGTMFGGDAWFDGATFGADAWFDGVSFGADAWFVGATFRGAARFDRVTLQANAGFDGATFHADAWFDGATFRGAGFDRATFRGDARFGWASFQDLAQFGGATFRTVAWFDRATFQADARFGEATFGAAAAFRRASFGGDARFGGATFRADASFGGATFAGDAWFDGLTFGGDARFGGATFEDIVRFNRSTFRAVAWFDGATFRADAWFDGATFRADARFYGATFQDYAWFDWVTFQANADFGGATLQDHAWFSGATFQADARFDGVTFQADARLDGAIVRRDARFVEAKFEQARELGPLLVYGLLRLDAAHFAQLTLIEASSRGLSCQRTHFPAGVQFRLRGAQVVLDEANLASPSLLTGVDTLSDARLARREQRLVQAVRRLAPAAAEECSEWPRLLSVQGANLAGLGVANIDLAQCRFAGAHNLDKLRFEAEVSFAAAPARLPWDWRQVLAEERAWRATQSNRWAAPDWWPAWLHKPYRTKWPRLLEPAQLAGLYRALRKAREDAKDEPGAADFYYGEMEMRRHARRGRTGGASRGQVERALLTAYWLVSGYGLRAWRALAALAVVLVAFAGLLVWGGGYQPAASFPDARPASTPAAGGVPSSSTADPARPPARPAPATTGPTSTAAARSTAPVADRSLAGALLYGARTIIGLNPTPPPLLTRFGEVLLIAVRVLGPLLLGLALLAVRGRVKR